MRRYLYYAPKYFVLRIATLFKAMATNPIKKRISTLPDYPGSSMSLRQSITLTLVGAKNTYDAISNCLNLDSIASQIISVNDLHLSETEKELSTKLKNLFDNFGSDKGTYHGYHRVYSKIFANMPDSELRIGEIGIGSNNTAVPSNMGKNGNPGASLRSWAQLAPKGSKIFGFDIDQDSLIQDEQISSFKLDQLDDASWNGLQNNLPKFSLDILIDDGLHSPLANVRSIQLGMEYLKPKGILVIEDISEQSLPVWRLIIGTHLLKGKFKIYKANHSYILTYSRD